MSEPLIGRRAVILAFDGKLRVPATVKEVQVVYTLRDDEGNNWTLRRGDFELEDAKEDGAK